MDFAKESFLAGDQLPGVLINSDIYRFNIRYMIAALNYVCLELVNSGHYLNCLPAVSLYEHLACTYARDLTHTIFARLIKMEALTKLNMFNEAFVIMHGLLNGSQLPQSTDHTFKRFPNDLINKMEFAWDSSMPPFDLNNLKVKIKEFQIYSLLLNFLNVFLVSRVFSVFKASQMCSKFISAAFNLPFLLGAL